MSDNEHEDFVETLSLAMPGEDEFSNNIDGSEEGEILAFVEWGAETHRVIYDARASVDFEDDRRNELVFTLDENGSLVRAEPPEVPVQGVWMSFYYDQSGATPHASEVEALRAAVGSSAQVMFVPFGTDVWDATRKLDADARAAVTCSKCGHASHGPVCLNMASDNDCSCRWTS